MKIAPRTRVIVIVAGVLLAAALAPSRADERKPPRIDPKVEKTVRLLSDYYGKLKSFTTEMAVSFTIEALEDKRTTKAAYRVAIRRPDKLAIVLAKGRMGMTMLYDGKKLYNYLPAAKAYTVSDAPKSLDDFFKDTDAGESPSATRMMMFVNLLALSKPYPAILRGVTEASHLGKVKLGKVDCHHLKFVEKDAEWELWVEAGARPLVRKLVLRLKDIAPPSAARIPEQRLIVVTVFDKWTVNTAIPDDRFAFTPPPGASEVKSFHERPPERREVSLLGKPAPAFQLPLLDGKRMNLAQHKGKDVVVLDFWATWCPPCRVSMPTLVGVTSSYKEKGVVFYGVNQGEGPEDIRAFQKKMRLTFPVALDEDGSVAGLYGIDGIPQTVIIGKDGTVQAVHVGAIPGLEERLRSDIEILLAGKSLLDEEEEEE